MKIKKNLSIHWTSPIPAEEVAQERGDRIYTEFFNLNGAPFSITPDPEFLFLSETHRSVIEKIQYGIQSCMGFMLLTGEVGTGKTTLCRALLDLLQDHIRTVYVINPSLSGQELLAGILDDLGITYPAEASKKDLIDRLNRFLLANEGQNPVVIIVDDAQTMPTSTLEDLRLLSNLETDKTKLLQMLLVGQPELLTNIDQPQLRQLKQRVAVNCHLDYLSPDEVGGYIERRLFIAGNQGQVRFAPKVFKQVHRQSGGVPRVINKICDMSLIAAYTTNSYIVTSDHLKAAASELIELHANHRSNGFTHRVWERRPLAAVLTAAALAGAMALGFASHALLGQGPQLENMPAMPSAAISKPVDTLPASPEQSTASRLSSANKAYILQLGSFNTLATTLRAVDIYTQEDIEAHWNEVQLGQKGLWYRVFVGRFASISAARQYQNDMDLRDAQILFAPWAVLLDRAGPAKHIADVKNHAQTRGVDSYIAPAQGERMHLCAGAFVSQARAEAMARQIQRQTGITTRVANFQSALISSYPQAAIDIEDNS